MTPFSEWQQLPQTKAFVKSLEQSIEQIKEEAIGANDNKSLEQVAISTLERRAEARILERLIEVLTSKEDENEQT